MTDVDDLYEPADDREPEPCDWYPAPEPVDLDDLQKLYDLAEADDALPSWRSAVYLRVPELIAELREARERIAEFEALPTRERWTVTSGLDVPPRSVVLEYADCEAAGRYGNGGKQVWRRRLTVHPWEPVDSSPPF